MGAEIACFFLCLALQFQKLFKIDALLWLCLAFVHYSKFWSDLILWWNRALCGGTRGISALCHLFSAVTVNPGILVQNESILVHHKQYALHCLLCGYDHMLFVYFCYESFWNDPEVCTSPCLKIFQKNPSDADFI